MKTISCLLLIGLGILLGLGSCTVEKRVYRSGYHIEGVKRKLTHKSATNRGEENNALTDEQLSTIVNTGERTPVILQTADTTASERISSAVDYFNRANYFAEGEDNERQFDESESVVEIDGNFIEKISTDLVITQLENRGALIMPTMGMMRNDKFLSSYANQGNAVFVSEKVLTINVGDVEKDKSTVEGYAIASLLLGLIALLLGLFIDGALGLIVGVLVIALGVIAIIRRKRNPGKYKGRGWAVTGIAIGSILTLLFFLVTFVPVGI